MRSSTTTKADVVADFRRGQILDAARRRITRDGVTGTTVESIAHAAGLAKGTVYLYYRSKDDIFAQLLAGDLAELEHQTVPVIDAQGPIDVRLRNFLTATLAFFDERRDFIEHCQFEISADVRRTARQTLGRVFAAQTEAWSRALASATAPPPANRRDAAARTIVSLAHGLTMQRLRGWHAGPIDAIVETATTLLTQGLAHR